MANAMIANAMIINNWRNGSLRYQNNDENKYYKANALTTGGLTKQGKNESMLMFGSMDFYTEPTLSWRHLLDFCVCYFAPSAP